MEQIEKHYKAQLAYSFDMALQNEFSLEENIELAREFVQKCFVADGMICDLAVHQPDREEGGYPIDLLSHIVLYPAGWRKRSYLSLGGVSPKSLERFLSERKDIESVYIATDGCGIPIFHLGN